MKIDAEITCRKTSYGSVCKWEGGKFALIGGTLFHSLPTAGKVVHFGRLKMRVIAFPYFGSSGHYRDEALVMLESPHAQLYWLYREKIEGLLRLLLNIEARVHGFLLKPYEGRVMPFTAWVADRLL